MCADATHGDANKDVIDGWLAIWQPRVAAAAEAFAANFAHAPMSGRTPEVLLQQVLAEQRQTVAGLGLGT